MTTTTLTYRAIPEQFIGLSFLSNSSFNSWEGDDNWKVCIPRTDRVMYIAGGTVQSVIVSASDITRELLLEIGFGLPHKVVTRVQIPFSFRSDTAVGYYLEQGFRLPRPIEVPINTTVCLRARTTVLNTQIRNGAKLLIMSNERPVQPYEMNQNENFKSFAGANGISVTERSFN